MPSLREQALFLALRRALARSARSWFRVLHFSVQADHVHLIVEADDKVSLSRGVAGLTIRLARALNHALGRRGGVWAERYHARALGTPREVRSGLVYVLMNRRKHGSGGRFARSSAFDPCSSAWWFEGWAMPPCTGPPLPDGIRPVSAPQTWLARTGWKRYGLIEQTEAPAR